MMEEPADEPTLNAIATTTTTTTTTTSSLWKQLQRESQQQHHPSQPPSFASSSSLLSHDLLRIPDYEDDLEDIVTCFPGLRRKTMEALYHHPINNDDEQQQHSHDDDDNNNNNNNDNDDHHHPQRPKDKSPKGSVDEPIQALVDLINAHPSFCTLSSCSGRIVLFDPNYNYYQQQHQKDEATLEPLLQDRIEEEKEEKDVVVSLSTEATSQINSKETPLPINTTSGKGQGAWLLTSHEEITSSELLLECMMNDETEGKSEHEHEHDDDDDAEMRMTKMPLVFKHEPMILHVAASTWSRGQQLLQLALQLGFRESGIVPRSSTTIHSRVNTLPTTTTTTIPTTLPTTTWMMASSQQQHNHRTHHHNNTPIPAAGGGVLLPVLQKITVMIRSHSLALTVPLTRRGPLRPSDAYLQALVQHANLKLRQNWTKLQQLHDTIAKTLFQTIVQPAPSSSSSTLLTTTAWTAITTNPTNTDTATTTASSNNSQPINTSVLSKSSPSSSCLLKCQSLPDLNLWGHAVIVIPVDDDIPPNKDDHGDDNLLDNDKDGDGASDTTPTTRNHKPTLQIVPKNVDVMVIGGYGKGPAVVMVPTRHPTLGRKTSSGGWMTMVSSKTKCQRSDQVYCLQRRNGVWKDHWMRLAPAPIAWKGGSSNGNEPEGVSHPLVNDDSNNTLLLGILPARRATFTPRESVDGCLLPFAIALRGLTANNLLLKEDKALIAIWGGRTSPCHPLDELMLYEHSTSSSTSSVSPGKLSEDGGTDLDAAEGETASSFGAHSMRTVYWMAPTHVQGQGPSPRWGHTMTALSGRFQGRLAVVVGGRNAERACIDSVHVLCVAVDSPSSQTAYLKWETIDLSTSLVPRFFHSAVALGVSSENEDNEMLLVFGGKTDPKDLFESFSDSCSDFQSIATTTSTNESQSADIINHQQQQPTEKVEGNLEHLPHNSRQQQHQQVMPPCLMSIHLASGTVERCEQILPLHYDHHPQCKLILEGSRISGTSNTCIPELGCAASVVQACDPISGQEEELVLVVGGTSATDTDPFLCFRATSTKTTTESTLPTPSTPPDLLMQPCPVVLEQAEAKSEMSVFVHHRCVALPSIPSRGELLLLGGGFSSFAFGPCFSKCFHATVTLVDMPPPPRKSPKFQSRELPKLSTQPDASQSTPSTGTLKKKVSLTNLPHLLDHVSSVYEATAPQTVPPPSQLLPRTMAAALVSNVDSNLAATAVTRTQWSNVVLVAKHNAKSLKMALEAASLLDPNFRITKSTIQPPTDYEQDEQQQQQQQQQLIAVPISLECLRLLQSTPTLPSSSSNNNNNTSNVSHNSTNMDWRKWVVGTGQQKVPFRTAHYARGSKKSS